MSTARFASPEGWQVSVGLVGGNWEASLGRAWCWAGSLVEALLVERSRGPWAGGWALVGERDGGGPLLVAALVPRVGLKTVGDLMTGLRWPAWLEKGVGGRGVYEVLSFGPVVWAGGAGGC
jgi:hypothetical protein